MSLVNTLMSGNTYGVSIDSSKYGHINGASRIAMESTQELHAIFMEEYNYNQAELAALTEGVALEGSQYEAVAEAAVTGAFAKIKEFLKKLWAKVKAFFHNVKRYLDSIFMGATEFVKKYKKEIQKIGTLKDFTYRMYEYDNDRIGKLTEKISVDNAMETIRGNTAFKKLDAYITAIKASAEAHTDKTADFAHTNDQGNDITINYHGKGDVNSTKADLKSLIDELEDSDKMNPVILKSVVGNDSEFKDPDTFDEDLFEAFRKGATNKDDMEDVDVTGVSTYVSILEKSKDLASKVTASMTNVDKSYGKIIKEIDKVADKVGGLKGDDASAIASVIRAYSACVSTAQSYENKFYNAWKSVIAERDSAYKGLIMAAFRHNKDKMKQAAK